MPEGRCSELIGISFGGRGGSGSAKCVPTLTARRCLGLGAPASFPKALSANATVFASPSEMSLDRHNDWYPKTPVVRCDIAWIVVPMLA